MTSLNDNLIMSLHEQNQKGIKELNDGQAAIREEQVRQSGLQVVTADKVEELSLIVIGDGNGHPGVVRKIDRIERNIESIQSDVKRLVGMWDKIVEGAKRLARVFLRWVTPILIAWIIAWFSSSSVRKWVHQFTLTAAPVVTEHKTRPQEASDK